MNESYKLTAERLLKKVSAFIVECEDEELTNDQWFIDFEIELSKLATKDHNRV